MARILFITPYYPPEKAAAAVRVSETARCLVKSGHTVTVLTTVPNYPSGIVPPEYRGHLSQEELLDGVRVIRTWSYITANKGFLRRVLAQLSFGCLAPILGMKWLERPDVIIIESHPLFNVIAGRMLAKHFRCPFLLMVSDLWPESAVQLGILRNRTLIRLAEWLEWSTYQRAGMIWALTDGIRQSLLRRGLPAERVFLLTNGVDREAFRPHSRVQARAELAWDNSFTVLYAGNHGLAQGLGTVLDAADLLRERPDIRFVLAGDGGAKADLLIQAEERKLENITFLEPLPHDRMPLLLACADVCLVPLRGLPIFEGALPSKMYEIMACGRPIVLGAEGEARRLIAQKAGAALAVEPENAEALTEALLYLYEHPEAAAALGARGQAFVEQHFDRSRLTAELEKHIVKLLAQNRSGSTRMTPTDRGVVPEEGPIIGIDEIIRA